MPAPERKPVCTRRGAKRAIVVGIGLALLCHALPPQHRELCHQLATICTGGNL